MALTAATTIYGIHSITLFSRTDGTPVVMLKALGDASFKLTPEYADLEAGSYMFPVDSEVQKINSEFSLSAKEYRPAAMEKFLAGVLTTNAAEATGAVSGFANKKGTSVKSAANGIDSVEVTSSDHADLKSGTYVIKATAAATATVYCLSDVDFKTGTDGVYTDDTLAIGTIDVASGDAVLANYGLTFSKVGTPAFVTGDTATFTVRKVNTGSWSVAFGQSGGTFGEYGVEVYGQLQANGTVTGMKLYKCRIAGMPINFTEKKFSEWQINIKVLYDETLDGVGEVFRIAA